MTRQNLRFAVFGNSFQPRKSVRFMISFRRTMTLTWGNTLRLRVTTLRLTMSCRWVVTALSCSRP